MEFSLLCSPTAVDWTKTRSQRETTHASCVDYVANGISGVSGLLLIMKGFVRINPDKKGHVMPIGLGWRLEPIPYRAEWSGSFSRASGVNRPICTAKRMTSVRVRSPSFSAKRERYVSTVFTPTEICLAICALV